MTTSGHSDTLASVITSDNLDCMNEEKPNNNETTEEENLRRYVELAIEIEASLAAKSCDLTESTAEASVSAGPVDPSTSKNTG